MLTGPLVKGLGALICLALLLAAGSYGYLLYWADRPSQGIEPVRIQVVSGDTLRSVARDLKQRDYLTNDNLLIWLGRITGSDRQLHAGEFELSPRLSPNAILKLLTTGEVVQYQFRVDEGITVAMLLTKLKMAPALDVRLQANDPVQLAQEMQLDVSSAEGLFFPDTYIYVKGDTGRSILERAKLDMDTALAAAWAAKNEHVQLASPAELLTLASIIEKETAAAEDRGLISQVFHRRLDLGMRLQTDPTVIYALGDQFDGNLTRAHLRMSSPFNTYRVHGLPPTPIALPSKASLMAAAQPSTGDYLYFVAKGDGASAFSRTLEEHNAAVRRYQLGGGS